MNKRLVVELNYGTLIEELRNRLAQCHRVDGQDDHMLKEQIRNRFAFILDVDPLTPLSEIIDQLAEKWQQDGLI